MGLLDYNTEKPKQSLRSENDQSQRYLDEGRAIAQEKLAGVLYPEIYMQDITDDEYIEMGRQRIKEKTKRTLGGTIKDVAVSSAKGVVGLGEAAVGLADIPTLGRVGKGMEKYLGYDPAATQEFLSQGYSSAQKAAFEEVEKAKGFVGTAKAMLKHPSTIGHAVVESAPQMLGGAAAARKLVASGMLKMTPAWKNIIAASIGEGLVSAGATAEGIRQQTEDGVLTLKQAAIPVISGVGTALFAIAGGRVAQKFGIIDPDTFLAGGSNVTSTGVVKRIIGGGITEGAFEELPQSMQEQVWLNAALDKPLLEGVGEAGATGTLTGFAMGAGFNIFTGKPYTEAEKETMATPEENDQVKADIKPGLIAEGIKSGDLTSEMMAPVIETDLSENERRFEEDPLNAENNAEYLDKYIKRASLPEAETLTTKELTKERAKVLGETPRRPAEVAAEVFEKELPLEERKLEKPTPAEPKTDVAFGPVGVEKIDLPEFKNMGEALTFGKKATPEQKELLKRRREVSNKRYEELISADKLNEATVEATKSQLDTEALDAEKIIAEHPEFDPDFIAAEKVEKAEVSEVETKALIKKQFKQLGYNPPQESSGMNLENNLKSRGYKINDREIVSDGIERIDYTDDKGISKHAYIRLQRYDIDGFVEDSIFSTKKIPTKHLDVFFKNAEAEQSVLNKLTKKEREADRNDILYWMPKVRERADKINKELMKEYGGDFSKANKDPRSMPITNLREQAEEAVKKFKAGEDPLSLPAKTQPPKIEKPKPPLLLTEDFEGEGIPEVALKTWKSEFAETYKKSEFSEPERWDEFKAFSKKEYAEGFPISEHFEGWMAKPKPKPKKEKVEVTPEKKEAWEMTPKEWTQESLQPTIEKMKIGETKVLPDKRIIVKSSQDLTYGETYISRSPVKTKMLDPSEIDQLPDKIKNFVERYEAGEKDLPPIYVSELMVNPKTGETFREIRDGHHRYYMAEEVGLEELPAMERVSGLYPEEHEAIVRNALKKGENVPENVLAEYPKLKPLPSKPPKAKPPEAAREEIKGEVIPEVKPKVEKEKVEVTKEDIEAFIKPLHHKYYLEGQNKGIAVEKLNAYGALQINKLVGSKLRANVDMDAVKQYLKEHPTKVEVTKKAGVRDEKAFATKATKPQETITRKDLRKIFKRMKHIRTGQDSDGNLWFKAEGRPKLTIFELDNITGHLNTSAGQIPVGSFLRNTIELKTGGEGHTADIGTAYHEFFHWLSKNGIISANDITALNRVIAKARGISESNVTEEHRAYYVGDNISAWETQKHPRIRRILRKLTDFMNAIYDFAAQAGWVKGRERTAEGVLRDISSGEILAEKKIASERAGELIPAHQMAGTKAIGAPTGQLVKAQEMLAEGKDKKEVWRETGWIKGVEGNYSWLKLTNESPVPNRAINSMAANAKFFSDLVVSKTFHAKGLNGFDIPTQREVMSHVFSMLHNRKIRNAVINSIPIDMVNILRSQQLTPNILFNNMPMLSDLLSKGRGDNAIPVLVDMPSSIVKTLAAVIAEMQNSPSFVSLSKDFFPTIITDIKGKFSILPHAISATKEQAGFTSFKPTGRSIKLPPTRLTFSYSHIKSPFDQNIFDNIKKVKDKPPENVWKFEIDDSGAELKIKTSLHPPLGIDTKSDVLSGILSHPELFKAYPQLRNLLTNITIGEDVKTKGELTEGQDRSAEGLKDLEPEISVYAKNMAEAKDTLLHEAQHAIQEIEGFARGGTPKTFEAIRQRDEGNLARTIGNYNKLLSKYAKEDNKEQYAAVLKVRDELTQKAIELQDYSGEKSLEDYKRLAGEIEARDTSARALLSSKHRKEIFPYEAQGIPEDQWIITEGKGTSFNILEQKAFSVKGGKDYSAMFEKYRVKRTTPLVDELTMGEEKPSFLETLEPVTSEDYLLNRKTSKSIKLTAKTNIKRVASEIAEGVDKFLGSTSTRIGRVSLKLKAKLRKLDFDINTKYAADVKSIHSLLKKAKKMDRNDFADWDYARKNSDINKINELVNKYNMQAEYAAYRKVLDDTRKEGLDVGLVIGEIEEYAPRILKDDRGFLKEIGKPEYRPLYSDQLKKRAQDMKMSVESLPLDLKADIISNIMLGGWVGLGGIPATKHRVLQKIPVNLNKYYMHSDAALMQHLYSMRKGIEARKFFGEIPKRVKEIRKRLYHAQAQIRALNGKLKGKLSEIESAKIKKQRNKYIGLEKQYMAYIQKYALQRDYTENIGAYIIELIEKKEIDAKHERIVNDMLKARFHEVGTRGVIQMYKNLSYIDTMGSPISALTQIGDMAWAMYEGGLIRSLKYGFKAAIKKSRITKEDVGVERIAQEFADSGTLGDAVSKVFKIVGLEKIDSIGKEALLNTALEKYQKRAKKEPLKFKKELKPIFGIETNSVIEDLVNDEISENVKLLVYSRLLDFQPVALSEMPQRYLDAGNGRLFYMLKTFTLKVFDVFRNESYNKIRYGNKADKIQGMKNFVRLSLFFVLANAGADELKDWVLGRKTDFKDRVVDNILRLCGVSKFVTWKARTEGVGSALARQVLPPFKFIDSAGKDIITAGDEKGLEVIGSIPVVGKLAYWHLGRGTSKREDLWNRRLRKQKAKLNKIKDGLEKTKNKTGYRREHRVELRKLRQVNELQGQLNDYRKRINRLKSMKEIPARKKRIQMLEVRRTELIKKFLSKN